MNKILVSGLINIETTLRVEGFPINYSPVRYPFFGVDSTASGVGYNVAKALTTLGDDAAHLLFLSDGHLPMPPEAWAAQLMSRYSPEIVVVGLGAQGALLAVRRDNFVERLPAVHTRPIVSTIGAGDALFSCFVHGYNRTRDPYESLRKAMLFASWKIGATGAAEGFLDEAGLERLAAEGAGP